MAFCGRAVPVQQPGQRRDLGGQRRGATLGLGTRGPCLGLAAFRLGAGGLGFRKRGLGPRGEVGRLLQGLAGGFHVPAEAGEAVHPLRARRALPFPLRPRAARGPAAPPAIRRSAA